LRYNDLTEIINKNKEIRTHGISHHNLADVMISLWFPKNNIYFGSLASLGTTEIMGMPSLLYL
jgi:hypothetical protein